MGLNLLSLIIVFTVMGLGINFWLLPELGKHEVVSADGVIATIKGWDVITINNHGQPQKFSLVNKRDNTLWDGTKIHMSQGEYFPIIRAAENPVVVKYKSRISTSWIEVENTVYLYPDEFIGLGRESNWGDIQILQANDSPAGNGCVLTSINDAGEDLAKYDDLVRYPTGKGYEEQRLSDLPPKLDKLLDYPAYGVVEHDFPNDSVRFQAATSFVLHFYRAEATRTTDCEVHLGANDRLQLLASKSGWYEISKPK